MAEVQTVTYDDFGNGIDRRIGTVSRAANKFLDLRNYWTTPGRKLKRRPPLRTISGLLDANTQATRYINGKILAVAPVGTTPTHTIVGYTVETVFFDMPEKALSEWVLVDLNIFNEKLIAVIKHRFDSTAAPWRAYLHVWDDKRPTYVLDPACPTTWTAELPLHAYGEGKLGAYANYTPRLAISADRVYLSRPDGNVGFCAVSNPRVWNTRTPEEILVDGKWVYWISDNSPGDTTLTLPFSYYDLTQAGKAAAYVLETCGSDGRWTQLREQSILTAYNDYRLRPTANRWGKPQEVETQITYRSPGDGRVFRFRMLAKPPALIQSGLYITPSGKVVGGVLTHEGDGELVRSFDVPTLAASTNYFIAVAVPGAPIPAPTLVQGVPTSMPFNGQERYWVRILANAISDGTGTELLYRLTGTVQVTAGGTRVVGAGGSLFRDELEIGRNIEINGERRKVVFIGGDADCEVDAPFTAAYGPGVGLRDPRYRYAYEIGDAGNEWYAEQEAQATFDGAGKDDAGYLGTAMYDATGSLPLCIATLQNRLLVQYPSALQAWAVGANALTDMRLLSIDGQAAGNHGDPQPVLMDGMTALPTSAGVRLFSPDGNNKDYIDFAAVGDMLRGIQLPALTRAVWWPQLRTYLTCAASGTDKLTFYTLTRHKDTKVLAWATWDFEQVTRVDAMYVVNDDLVIQSGRNLYRLEALGTDFRDDTDPADAPFESFAKWIYFDMGHPEKNKRLVRCEILQIGKATLSIYANPYRPGEATPGPTASGMTVGRQRVPLAVMGPGIGLAISSREREGHELDALAIDYMLLKR